MKDSRVRALYARAVAQRSPATRGRCPTPEDLAALAERTLPAAERERLVDHLTECAPCRREYDLLGDLAASMRPRLTASRSWLAAAAAVALLVGGGVLWQAERGGPSGVLRGGGAKLVVLEPGASASSAGLRFVWRAVPDASRYDYELLGPAGTRAFAAATTDTFVVLPDSLTLVPGETYRWWVRAWRAGGAQVDSELRELRILNP